MENEKLTKRQIQAIQTKEKIYNIAIKLMEKKGFENITIDEIAKNAEVSVGAFYHHFQSKNDILDEIFDRIDEHFRNNVTNKLTEKSTFDKILKYFQCYARFNLESGIDTAKQVYSVNSKTFLKEGRYMKVLLQKIIEEGQLNNEITIDVSSKEIAEYLIIVARGIMFHWCLHDSRDDYDFEGTMRKLIKRLLLSFQK